MDQEEEKLLVVRKVNDDEKMTSTTRMKKMTVTNVMAIVESAAKIKGHVEHVSQLCIQYFLIYMIGSMFLFMMHNYSTGNKRRIVGLFVIGILNSLGFFSIFRWLHTRAVKKVNSFLIMNSNNQESTTTSLECSNAVMFLILWCITSYLCLYLVLVTAITNELCIAQLVYMFIFEILLNRLLINHLRWTHIDSEMSLYEMMIKQQNPAAAAAPVQLHWKCTTPMLCGESCDCLATKKQLNEVTNGYRIEEEGVHDQKTKLVDMLCEDAKKKYQLSTEDTRFLREIIITNN